MNPLTYFFYTIHVKIGQFFTERIDREYIIQYKVKRKIKLNQAEFFQILQDVDRVIYEDMKLSEYIQKYGVYLVDEKFGPLLKRKRKQIEPFNIFEYAKMDVT